MRCGVKMPSMASFMRCDCSWRAWGGERLKGVQPDESALECFTCGVCSVLCCVVCLSCVGPEAPSLVTRERMAGEVLPVPPATP